jgi:hypothetical protein
MIEKYSKYIKENNSNAGIIKNMISDYKDTIVNLEKKYREKFKNIILEILSNEDAFASFKEAVGEYSFSVNYGDGSLCGAEINEHIGQIRFVFCSKYNEEYANINDLPTESIVEMLEEIINDDDIMSIYNMKYIKKINTN